MRRQSMNTSRSVLVFVCVLLATATVGRAGEEVVAEGVSCSVPELHCPDADCGVELIIHQGNAIEPKTGRSFFLDYPCDLDSGEGVNFVLNVHGTAAPANWQRHYFPAHDFKDEYRLIVATPKAQGDSAETRMAQQWGDDVDLVYLRGVVEYVYETFADLRIDRMWLVGHSQGGGYVQKLACKEGFRDRVDGIVALAGGYPGLRGDLPDCEFSFILETGSEDRLGNAIPERAPWAEHLGCGQKIRRDDVVDIKAGYVYDTRDREAPFPGWGGKPAPGTAEVYQYLDCRDGRVVADVIRQGKGHTEGHEPAVTEQILRLMLSSAK